MYDVIIIGAGPGGIFSAYELSEKRPDLKIAVFEAGDARVAGQLLETFEVASRFEFGALSLEFIVEFLALLIAEDCRFLSHLFSLLLKRHTEEF